MATRTPPPLWRHGDVLVMQIEALPAGAGALATVVLARGEATGHMHRIADPKTARLFEHGAERFLEVTAASAQLVHEEHAALTLPRGVYRYWQQREYAPAGLRTVAD